MTRSAACALFVWSVSASWPGTRAAASGSDYPSRRCGQGKKLGSMGHDLVGGSSEQFTQLVRKEIAR